MPSRFVAGRGFWSLFSAVVLFVLLDVSVLAMNLWISWQVERDATAINLAGRQRMLSQRMTKAALLMERAEGSEARQTALNELQTSARLFDQTLAAFARGGLATGGDNRALTLEALRDAEALALVAVAEERWQPLHQGILELGWPLDEAQASMAVEALVSGNQGLLDIMNRLTSRMEAASLEQTKRLRLVQTLAFVLALVNFLVILRMLLTRYREAAARSQQLHELIDQLGAGVLVLDAQGRVHSANRVARELFGQGDDYLPGRSIDQLLRQENDHHFGYRGDGSLWVAQLRFGELVLGERPVRIATVLDVTERYYHARDLAYQAQHDALTGLPNRRLFEDRYTQALAHAERNGSLVGLALLDLDKFKPINDTYGHEVGDRVLQAFAERVQACLRASDTLARLGGDEFVCLLQDIHGEQDLQGFARRVGEALAAPLDIQGKPLTLTASVGLALYPEHGSDGKALMAAADEAMYRAKGGGLGCALAVKAGQQSLLPFPGTPSPLVAISVQVERLPSGELRLEYHLKGDVAALKLPDPQLPGSAEGLWQHTCCEAFVAVAGQTAYREFNFSPSGEWAIYDFGDYRQRRESPSWIAVPEVIFRAHSAGACVLTVRLPACLLPELGLQLQVGLTTVVEDKAGRISYWALSHPGEKPDFHHRDGFGLILGR